MGKQMKRQALTDERWQAIINNDSSYDGQFYYAVKTTGIFCRPSCKSKPPKKENIGLFLTTDQALSANYRPCKRCKPTGRRLPDDEWIALVTEYINRNYMVNLTLFFRQTYTKEKKGVIKNEKFSNRLDIVST